MAVLTAMFHGLGAHWQRAEDRFLNLLGERIQRKSLQIEAAYKDKARATSISTGASS